MYRIVKHMKNASIEQPLIYRVIRKIMYLINIGLVIRNAKIKKKGSPDGLPIPPLKLIFLVTDWYDIEKFLENGHNAFIYIKDTLSKNGIDIKNFKKILDFGCGCGRILRNWKNLENTKFYGTDVNPRLISWCKKYLDFVDVKTNKFSSKLGYNDNQFDFIYSVSVFTHFNEELQSFWMDELIRILKPGGYLLLTLRTSLKDFYDFTPQETEMFENGIPFVRNEKLVGSNLCKSYTPEKYVREKLAKNLEIVDIIRDAAVDFRQDVVLFKKPLNVSE